MMMSPEEEAQARRRFLVINLIRFSGVVMILFSLLVLKDAVALPHALGYALAVIGMVDTFVVPQMLARRWSSKRK